MSVQFINAEQTIDLRSRILRPEQSIEMCRYSEDNLDSTFHLGIFFENKIVCNGTFMQQSHEFFKDAKKPYRLRGMATDLALQKKGLGSQIIQKALAELQQKNCDLLWFNARTSAEIFYKKLGFEQIDQVFEIAGIGPHKVMYKRLKSD